MTNDEIGNEALRTLAACLEKPNLFIWPLTSESAINFLAGFRTGLQAGGFPNITRSYVVAAERRGWFNGNSVSHHLMRSDGLDESQIIAAEIEMTAEAVQAILDAGSET